MATEKVAPKRSDSAAKPVELVVRAPGARQVLVTGDFTGWSAEGISMTKTATGDWKVVLKFFPGQYQYRILVDGQWQDHADAKKRIPNPFGTENCVLTVS